jgi:heme-degrading monooxygenase HmoA
MYVVIFRSTRTDKNVDQYREWSEKMDILVAEQHGYQSHFGFRDSETGQGVTVSYFESEDSIKQWHNNSEHVDAQALGRAHFYESFSVEVAVIKRHYEWHK